MTGDEPSPNRLDEEGLEPSPEPAGWWLCDVRNSAAVVADLLLAARPRQNLLGCTNVESDTMTCRLSTALAVTVGALIAFPLIGAAGQPGSDYDCTDFDSREDAQALYEEIGGPQYDPYHLDDDGDGIACEEWALEYEQDDGSNGEDGIDRDCAEFATQAAAQRYFLRDGGSVTANIDHLDPNHNGIACEAGEPG